MASKKQTNLSPPADVKVGWHFLPSSMTLDYGDGRRAEVGKTLSMAGTDKPRTCHRGMHASAIPGDAVKYKKGPVLTKVKVWGDISSADDKFCGRHRHVVWAKALTTKDIKACLKSAGYSSYRDDLDGLVKELGNAADIYSNKDKVNKWLLEWAKKNGSEGNVSVIHLEYVKKALTSKIVKGFLSERMVRTLKEIKADMGDVFDIDGSDMGNESLEDVLNDMRWDDDVCEIEGYTESGASGFVLKLKRKR